MKPYLASLINAFVLILLGLWGYFSSETPSFTSLIPAVVGLILLLLNWGLRKDKSVIAHIVVVLTFLVLVALVKPLTGAIERSDSNAIIRVSVMIASSLMAMIYFIKSFMSARSSKKN